MFITDSSNIYNLEELTSVGEQQINFGEMQYRVICIRTNGKRCFLVDH